MTDEAEGTERDRGSTWFSWLFGIAVLATLVAVVERRSEGEEFARQLEQAEPGFVWLALALQLGTYVADAAIFQGVLSRAGHRERLSSFVPLGLAKLFMDQAIPSGGISGTMLVIRALDRRGVPHAVVSAAVLVDLLAHYVAHVIVTASALVVLASLGRLLPVVLVPSAMFGALAIFVPSLLVYLHRRGAAPLPRLVARLPIQGFLRAIAGARPDLVASLPCSLARPGSTSRSSRSTGSPSGRCSRRSASIRPSRRSSRPTSSPRSPASSVSCREGSVPSRRRASPSSDWSGRRSPPR